MSTSVISNPPYNMKWKIPAFAQLQSRFYDCELPPEKNANFAFMLTALDKADKKAVFILPCNVLSGGLKQEEEIRKYLIEKNLIEAVIMCPNNMFESTDIPTCVVVFNKNKSTAKIELIDMRNTYEVEEREQKGQYGGASHTNRVYKKAVKVFSDEQIERAVKAIEAHLTEKEFSVCVMPEDIRKREYKLSPSAYFEVNFEPQPHREYQKIIADLNHVIEEKNGLKLTMNEKLAKVMGFYEIFQMFKESEERNRAMNDALNFTGEKIIAENFIAISKKAGELKFENGRKDCVSTILISILQMWKQHIMYLNVEENRYLMELRDALLPDLMSGRINIGNKNEEFDMNVDDYEEHESDADVLEGQMRIEDFPEVLP